MSTFKSCTRQGVNSWGPPLLLMFRLMLILLLFIGLITACGSKPDISKYEDIPITVKGLAEEDFEITPAKLADMECVSGSGTGDSDKAGTVEGYGPDLDSFLAGYGKERSDFSKVKFVARDGYKKTVSGDMLQEKEIVFSLSNGKDSLGESETPMRLLIPGAESSYWVYGVVEIEFIGVNSTIEEGRN